MTRDNMALQILRASAGSGKTFSLVCQYLKIILAKPQKYKHILAITFTNKAATEMKERILKALKELSLGQNPYLEKLLGKSLSPQVNIREQAERVLKNILHYYGDFAITTIDSFMFRILQAFTLELGLPLQFNVLLSRRRLNDYVTDQLLACAGHDDFLTNSLMDFIYFKLRAGQGWNIEQDIQQFLDQMDQEKNHFWVEAIGHWTGQDYILFKAELEERIDDYIRNLNLLGQQGLDLIKAKGIEIKQRSAADFLVKISRISNRDIDELVLYKKFADNEWYPQTAAKLQKDAYDELLAGKLNLIRERTCQLYNQEHSVVLAALAIMKNIYLLSLFNQIKNLVEQFKKESNVVPINEFNYHVHRIVGESAVPFIFYIIGEKYDHFLIDEFQDTSVIQWENLVPLIENALGYGHTNMVVGDGKQSIYRWRGGEVTIMEEDIFHRFHRQQIEVDILTHNHRSRKNIVTFNNRFFSAVRDELMQKNKWVGQIYQHLDQQAIDEDSGGFVSLTFVSEENNNMDTVGQRVKGVIDELISHGYEYRDIGILVREKKEGYSLTQYLLPRSIPVISPDSLLLADSPLIDFFIQTLKYIVNPQDQIARSVIICFYLLYHKDHHKIEDFLNGDAFAKKVMLPQPLQEFFRRVDELIGLPIYEIVEELIRIFKLADSMTFTTAGYLVSFLDIVLFFTSTQSIDISSFLAWWEINQLDYSLASPAEKQAVHILTIHKAKGLEFPVVIIPFADWEFKQDQNIWLKLPDNVFNHPLARAPLLVRASKKTADSSFAPGLEKEMEMNQLDNMNLLYVALTRPKDRMYIISGKNHPISQWFFHHAVPWMKKDGNAESIYEWGSKTNRSVDSGQKTGTGCRRVEGFAFKSWGNRIAIRLKAGQSWPATPNESYQRRRRGILIHQILARIKKLADIEDVLAWFSAEGEFLPAEGLDIKSGLEKIFALDQVREWFAGDYSLFSECAIISRNSILRPDRVMVKGNKVTIIDFKTGQKEKEHYQQMERYLEAIQQMDYPEVEAYLLYIDDPEVVRI